MRSLASKPPKIVLSSVLFVTVLMVISLHPFSRTTAAEEPAEGPRQVSVVPAQADEVTAEHRPNTKVSPIICSFLGWK